MLILVVDAFRRVWYVEIRDYPRSTIASSITGEYIQKLCKATGSKHLPYYDFLRPLPLRLPYTPLFQLYTAPNHQCSMDTFQEQYLSFIQVPDQTVPLSAPEWPQTHHPQAISWFKHLRWTITSMTTKSIQAIEAALHLYEKTSHKDSPRYTKLHESVPRLLELWDNFIPVTQLSRFFLLTVAEFMMSLGDLVNVEEMYLTRGGVDSNSGFVREMLEVRKSARTVIYEGFIIGRLVQEAVLRFEDLGEGYTADQMFVGLPGGFPFPGGKF